MNIRGVQASSRLNIALVMVDILTQVSIAVLGVLLIINIPQLIHNVHWGVAPTTNQLLFGISISMIAYTGIETVSNLGSEARRPEKSIPWAVLLVFVIGDNPLVSSLHDGSQCLSGIPNCRRAMGNRPDAEVPARPHNGYRQRHAGWHPARAEFLGGFSGRDDSDHCHQCRDAGRIAAGLFHGAAPAAPRCYQSISAAGRVCRLTLLLYSRSSPVY